MLGYRRSHAEYQKYLVDNILPIYAADKAKEEYYQTALSKLYILDLDTVKSILEPYYSHTGGQQKINPKSFVPLSLCLN